jgi:hypothetical protein
MMSMNDASQRYQSNHRNWRNTIMTLANLASHAPSAYDLLYRMGLERRRSRAIRAASCAGWMGIGMAVGSGLALWLAPRFGSEVREAISEQARRARDYVAPREEGDGRSRRRSSSASSPSSQL